MERKWLGEREREREMGGRERKRGGRGDRERGGTFGVTNAPLWYLNIQLAVSREAGRHQHRNNLTATTRRSFIITPAGTLHGATGTRSCSTFLRLFLNFSRPRHHGPAKDGHRRFGTACKYVLWRRRSCGFWRRSSLWSPIFSFLSPVVCSAIGPPRECLKNRSGSVLRPRQSPRARTAPPEHRAKTVGR